MNPRLRLVLASVSVASFTTALSLLLLTVLDHHLGQPAILRADLALQGVVHGWTNPPLTSVMLALTWMGSVKIFATALALVLVLLLLWRRTHDAVLLTAAITGAFVLNETFKLHFHRARPHVPWSIGDEHTFSFPSGHSLFALVLYGTLAYLAWRGAHTLVRRAAILFPALLLTLAIGLSRIYLGMHYPTDVLAGFITGALWLTTVVTVDRIWRTYSGVSRSELSNRNAR